MSRCRELDRFLAARVEDKYWPAVDKELMAIDKDFAALTARVEELEAKLAAVGEMVKALPEDAWGAFPEDIVPEIQARMERILASEPEVIAVVEGYGPNEKLASEQGWWTFDDMLLVGKKQNDVGLGGHVSPVTVTITRKEAEHE